MKNLAEFKLLNACQNSGKKHKINDTEQCNFFFGRNKDQMKIVSHYILI